MWKLFQLVVFLAVSFAGIYWQWTPNGLALGIVALIATMIATAILGDLFRLVRWAVKKLRPVLSEQRTKQRLPGGR
jgi:hypothetical protein